MLAAVQIACLIAFALMLLVAAWQDLRSMRIADGLSIGIAASFVAWAGAGLAGGSYSLVSLGLAATCAVGVFLAGATAFAAGALGGGDVKLAAVTALYAGPGLLLDFVLVVAVSGGLLGLAILAGAPIGPVAAGDRTVRARLGSNLPYGPAIALGGLWVAFSLASI